MQSPAVSDEEVRPTDDSFDELAERRHFESVCRTMLKYADFAEMGIERRQEHLARLSPDMARMLPSSVWSKLPEMFDAVAENQAFLQCVVEFQDYRFSDRAPGAPLEFPLSTERIAATQMHRNQAILHSLAREWSEEGRRERDSCFAPLLDELQRVLPVSEDNLFRQRVLVPGAGLARLAVETAARGYATQANEYSMFMLTASHFVLNGITDDKSFQIFPWLDRVCNVAAARDPLACLLVPDRTAGDILDGIEASFPGARATLAPTLPFPVFSMAAGDFVQTYGDASQAGEWDAVVTCFFIDTAPVVMEYIDVIMRMLRPGGVWINLGPLLYHWVTDSEGNNDERYDQSIELSWEEVRYVIEKYGFEMCKEEWIECDYTRHTASMMWTMYRTIHFTARKPLTTVAT